MNNITDLVPIEHFDRIFDLLTPNKAYDVLLKYSNKYGVKLLHKYDMRVVIEKECFDAIAQRFYEIKRMIPTDDVIVDGASRYILFEEGNYVYFLVSTNGVTPHIVYVGKTTCMARRFGEHVKTKEFDLVYYIHTPYADILELFCINHINPSLNNQVPTNMELFEKCANFCIKKM